MNYQNDPVFKEVGTEEIDQANCHHVPYPHTMGSHTRIEGRESLLEVTLEVGGFWSLR